MRREPLKCIAVHKVCKVVLAQQRKFWTEVDERYAIDILWWIFTDFAAASKQGQLSNWAAHQILLASIPFTSNSLSLAEEYATQPNLDWHCSHYLDFQCHIDSQVTLDDRRIIFKIAVNVAAPPQNKDLPCKSSDFRYFYPIVGVAETFSAYKYFL